MSSFGNHRLASDQLEPALTFTDVGLSLFRKIYLADNGKREPSAPRLLLVMIFIRSGDRLARGRQRSMIALRRFYFEPPCATSRTSIVQWHFPVVLLKFTVYIFP